MFGLQNPSPLLAGLRAAFADRQKDLFASLDAAEKERAEKCKTQTQGPPIFKKNTFVDNASPLDCTKRKTDPKQFRGKESIFKRPEMPPPKRARSSLPDHQRNPHKWTRYSLGDVSPQDMSERSNTVTALSFLRELQARKDCTNEEDSTVSVEKPVTSKPDCTNEEVSTVSVEKPVTFKPMKLRNEESTGRVNVITTATSEEGERPSFRSSKVVMPEYVIGQKKDKKKQPEKKAGDQPVRSSVIKLVHLANEEDE